jgi:hypothetical protein
MTIPDPEFLQWANVWLHVQGATIPTTIRVRHYDPDSGTWFYRVQLSGKWHMAHELSDRTGEAA